MSERKIRWYGCRKDALLVLLLGGVACLLNPIDVLYMLSSGKDDMGILGMIGVLLALLILGTKICKEHFWSWSLVAVLMVYGIHEWSIWRIQPIPYYTAKNYINDVWINGVICFVIISPFLGAFYKWKKRGK